MFTAISRKVVGKNVHATIPKGIEGGFEFTVFQRNFKEWQGRQWVLKESNKSRFDSYSGRNSVSTISHITFRDCCVHFFSDILSRNSCIQGSKYPSENLTVFPQGMFIADRVTNLYALLRYIRHRSLYFTRQYQGQPTTVSSQMY